MRQIDELLDILIDSKEPFREKQLGGGPWQASSHHLGASEALFSLGFQQDHAIGRLPGRTGRQWTIAALRLIQPSSVPMSLDAPQVVYTRGPLLWQGFTLLSISVFKRKLAPRSNAPSQEYDPADRSVINRASILGSLAVEASGRYRPVVGAMHQHVAKFVRLQHAS